ncbi:hypothetical protein [Streptomyces sp. NPDC046870]|uniref:hypothetical protein n=1 Tax=Streptomyces sp. NPDC046870 TaxID=3155135 RepID=UPI003456006E
MSRWSPARWWTPWWLCTGDRTTGAGGANGWGTTALMGALFSYWLLALGITAYRSAAAGTPAG